MIVCLFIWYPFGVERYSCGDIDAQVASKVWATGNNLPFFGNFFPFWLGWNRTFPRPAPALSVVPFHPLTISPAVAGPNLMLSIESPNVHSEAPMPALNRPLTSSDFEGEKIKKQDRTPLAEAEDETAAADIAERLNDDEARREEDKCLGEELR